jgi:HK97 family phage prohead protease
MPELERRAVLELRAAPAKRRLEGLAAPFDQVAHIGGFDEVITRGAFTATLSDGHDIVALADHDPRDVLARTRNGSLRLAETRSGLEFSLDLPDTQLGRDVLHMAENELLGGMSFGFRVRPAGERWDKMTRELRSLDLVEISTVAAWPAYDGTVVAARSRMPIRLALARRWMETLRWGS